MGHTNMTASANGTLNTELIEISKISFRVAMPDTHSDYVNATNTPAQLLARMAIFATIAFVCAIVLIGIYVAHRHGRLLRQKTIWEKY